jgi:hypothetical protein
VLVVRQLRKLIASVKFGVEAIQSRLELNKLVVASHICVTFAFTISELYFVLNVFNPYFGVNIMGSVFYFFGAVADLFLSLMLWFIFDRENAPDLLVQGDKVYVVADVIKSQSS